MSDLGRFIHPRRLWLWSMQYKKIKLASNKMLPAPYRLDKLITEYRPDIESLKSAGVLNYSNELPSNKTVNKTNNNNLQEAALGAAEGGLFYGQGLLEQLHNFDAHFAQILAEGLKATLINSANLSLTLEGVASLTQATIPGMFLPLAQPIINRWVFSNNCADFLLAGHVGFSGSVLSVLCLCISHCISNW